MENKPLSEELVIVGYKHGVYADKLTPIMNGEPMKEKSLKELLTDDVVALFMEPNEFDENSIGVYNMDSQLIGHLWSVQAAALRRWMSCNQRDFVKVRIEYVVSEAEALIAAPLEPITLDLSEPCNSNIDIKWAYNLPEVLQSIEDQSLAVGMTLLRNHLAESMEWDETLEYRIENIMNYLPIDLSAHRFTECIDVYNMMRASEIEGLRQKSGVMLGKLIKRGSKSQLMWWKDNWLPGFFECASEGDLMAIYQAAGYNIERVIELLNRAPCGLFYLYQANKFRFAKHLLYSYLPKDVYDRLLTLLAVWEMMNVKEHKSVRKTTIRKSKDIQVKDGSEVCACDKYLPKSLTSEQAQKYWELLKQHHFVDDNYMLLATTTRQQTCYIAELFAEKLEIKTKWKTFEKIWNIKNLAQEKHHRQECGLLPSRSDEIDEIFRE